MTRRNAIFYAVATATVLVVSHANAQMAITMTNEWKFDQPVIITGPNLDGDQPSYNKLCIAPVTDKTNMKCYDPDDSHSGLTINKWDNYNLSFNPPADIPVEGIVILKIRTTVQECFGSAGCVSSYEDAEKEIGNYKAFPFISSLIDTATGKEVFALVPNNIYIVRGAFFGEGKSKIFLQASKELNPGNILAWSYNEITFRVPAEISPHMFSVNNGVTASQFDLSSDDVSSDASSSKKLSTSSQETQSDSPPFSDVSNAHPYSAAIRWAKQSGILQGYPDGSFKPDNVVNRAEFLKIILGAKGSIVGNTDGSSGFKDVDENGWYAPYVRFAKEQEIIQGYPDGTFKPNQAVNFAEALKMAYVGLGVPTNDISGNWYDRFLQHAKLNNVLFTSDARMDTGMNRKDVVWIAWKLMTHNGDWKQPPEDLSEQSSITSSVEFKDGTYLVGKDIREGIYRTRKGSSGCYYARLSGFSGEFGDIIANESTDAPAIITIASTDKGFTSSHCGTWTQDLSPITTSRTSFGDGMFIIGTDIDAGMYKSAGSPSCYYARLGSFTGAFEDIITNENTDSSAIISISPSDKGFKSSRCGTWTKM